MHARIKQILLAADSLEGNHIFPSSHTPAISKVLKVEVLDVKDMLVEIFNHRVYTVHSFAQDSPYKARINIVRLPRGNPRSNALIELIFSNFARMVSIGVYEGANLEEGKLSAVIEEIERRDFVYIPRDVLNEKYDGEKYRNQFPDTYTWYDRFFNEL
jgi:hypothetical protein